jgi:60 kDa SS-A/Ro ribonucleoprotein
MKQWSEFKSRNADAKLVCIDIQPYTHTQAQERHDILNVGGFSDQVFSLVSEFANGNLGDGHWAGVIDRVEV